MRKHVLLASLLVLALGCRGTERSTSRDNYGGTMVIAVGADADNLLPPLTINPTGTQVSSLLFDRLAELGDDLNTIGDAGFEGRLARRWTWAPDSLSIALALDPRARWHDGRPVTARDVRFTYQLYTDPEVGSQVAPLLASIDSATVRDSLTAVFWFKRRTPEQFFDAAFQMRILPEHLLAGAKRPGLKTSEFARHPIGTGPFRFARWTAGSSIELVADTANYRGRPHLDRVIWSVAPDPNAAAVKFFSGEADFIEFLRPPDLPELARHPQLKATPYPALQHVYLQFNLRDPRNPQRPHPIFGDREVRRALSMAVDRKRLVASVFDSLGVVSLGPVVRALSTFDRALPQIPCAPDSAARLLDRLGWRDVDGDGYREEGGQPLRFTILYPSSSMPRSHMAVLLQDMFKHAGARVDLEPLEFVAWNEKQQSRKFDATLNGIALDPSPSSIRQMWSTAAARSKEGNNYGSYESPQFDALVDSAVAEMDPKKAKAYYRRAYETIIADAPAIWLYEPVMTAGVHKRIRPVGMRADTWWVRLADWYIPAGERTSRDNLGLAQR